MYRNGDRVETHIRKRQTFKVGNVSGDWYNSDKSPRWGRLNDDHPERKSEIQELLKDRDVYIVFSYLTPIAYAWDKTVHVPDIKYSRTTTNHQNTARLANRLGTLPA